MPERVARGASLRRAIQLRLSQLSLARHSRVWFFMIEDELNLFEKVLYTARVQTTAGRAGVSPVETTLVRGHTNRGEGR
jgi:hypothetical protein